MWSTFSALSKVQHKRKNVAYTKQGLLEIISMSVLQPGEKKPQKGTKTKKHTQQGMKQKIVI